QSLDILDPAAREHPRKMLHLRLDTLVAAAEHDGQISVAVQGIGSLRQAARDAPRSGRNEDGDPFLTDVTQHPDPPIFLGHGRLAEFLRHDRAWRVRRPSDSGTYLFGRIGA